MIPRVDQVHDALPATRPELMERFNASRTSITRWLNVLRKEGRAHIGAWRRSFGPGNYQPVYHAGPGEDAVCELERIPVKVSVAKHRKLKTAGLLRPRPEPAAPPPVVRPTANPFDALFSH